MQHISSPAIAATIASTYCANQWRMARLSGSRYQYTNSEFTKTLMLNTVVSFIPVSTFSNSVQVLPPGVPIICHRFLVFAHRFHPPLVAPENYGAYQ